LWGDQPAPGDQDSVIELHIIGPDGKEYVKTKTIPARKKQEERSLPVHPNHPNAGKSEE
jgi:hypothetical protein